MRKLIFGLFATLLFFVPLILWPYTSEVFEFNKIVMVYVLTTLIFTAWTVRCIIERKFIFSRTILDIPLLVFLGSQVISTFLSIDSYTSVFGYYSRFNGGLLSTVCYLVLYWAFVSNFDSKDALKLVKVWLFTAGVVALIGLGEHFKFFAVCAPIQYSQVHSANADPNLTKKYSTLSLSEKFNYNFRTSCWVQDVESRVFATTGQPNWLAAWITALIPITLALMLNTKKLNAKFLYTSLSVLFFTVLLFTKSRSGLLGFIVADVIFWGYILLSKFKENLKQFVICNLSFVILALAIGTQFTPSLYSFFKQPTIQPANLVVQGTALENGGTESGTIRKIVWKGAMKIWQNYPVFGTGLETFAYSYYSNRPTEHNVTSEWDFIYNKAHNEFLNFAANSGTFGLVSYLVLIGFSVYTILNPKHEARSTKQIQNSNLENSNLFRISDFDIRIYNYALLSGFISLSVSNFFGFSVVPTQLEFFLFPAFAIALAVPSTEYLVRNKTIETYQKIGIGIILLLTSYLLFLTSRYWYSDILYAKAKAQNSVQRPDLAVPLLDQAIKYEKGQAIYYGEIATSYSTIAMAYDQEKDASGAAQFTELAIDQIENAIALAPANVNLHRQKFGIYVRLSTIDEKYLTIARDSLIKTIKLAPTDPKLYYNLGIADANLGQTDAAELDFKKSIELKPNYSDARIQYAALLVHLNKVNEAKEELNYILTKIDPGNTTAKAALDNIK